MSKASEYLKLLQHPKPSPPFFLPDYGDGSVADGAFVDTDGDLDLSNMLYLPATEALRFAAWIIDTFGEDNDKT